MSTLRANQWLNLDGTENFKCRAWVNFNGTGTPAIRASGNVSSLVDNSAGNFTINFANAMPDANYAALPCASFGTTIPGFSIVSQAAGSVTVRTDQKNNVSSSGSDPYDPAIVGVAVFR